MIINGETKKKSFDGTKEIRLAPKTLSGIRGLLRKDISNTLIEFSAYFRELCSKSLRMSDLERLENSIALTLCKLERIFPPTFFDIMVHLSIHLATEAKIAGPVQYIWMYPFERYLRTLKSYVRNNARPEGSIAEGIIAQECNSKIEQLAISDWNRATMCVLKNCEEVSPYVREHIEEVQSKYDSDVELRHEEQFLGWFQAKIAEMFDNQDKTVSQELLGLARGPNKRVNKYTGYLINGFRFHTKEHKKFLKTQNSGVFVQGDDGLTNKKYYGLILDIIEL
uniref:DUF4218 domain-containing protein n=1 Tax=Ananas comosus var. bracteatus TaxID=296719 RepID=A0A6V7QUQ2_ANACO